MMAGIGTSFAFAWEGLHNPDHDPENDMTTANETTNVHSLLRPSVLAWRANYQANKKTNPASPSGDKPSAGKIPRRTSPRN